MPFQSFLIKSSRIINKLPEPQHYNATPYKTGNFSIQTREKCYTGQISKRGSCKVVFIGDAGVGKSTLINSFSNGYVEIYKPTIGIDFKLENFEVLSVPFLLQLWDTAGTERFRSMARSYFRKANVLVILFDTKNLESLQNTERWLIEAKSVNSDEPLIFLVGTKRELLNEEEYMEMWSLASYIANNINAELWIVSAKTGDSVTDLFQRICGMAFESYVYQIIDEENDKRKMSIDQFLKLGSPKNQHLKKKKPTCCTKH